MSGELIEYGGRIVAITDQELADRLVVPVEQVAIARREFRRVELAQG